MCVVKRPLRRNKEEAASMGGFFVSSQLDADMGWRGVILNVIAHPSR